MKCIWVENVGRSVLRASLVFYLKISIELNDCCLEYIVEIKMKDIFEKYVQGEATICAITLDILEKREAKISNGVSLKRE